MKDPERIDRILGMVGRLWKMHPDVRLHQLLSVVTEYRGDLFYFEDHLLEDKLREHLGEAPLAATS